MFHLLQSHTKKHLLILILICAIPSFLFTQNYQRFDYLPVTNTAGDFLRYPWTGGVNNVQFGKVDINHDGTKDLVVFDKNNRQFLPFLITHTSSTNYNFNSGYTSNFPIVSSWFILKDYNCDGIEDIFTYNGVGNLMVYIGYYENDTLKYKLQQNGFYYQGTSGVINVYCSEVNRPTLADINQDGDLDIISYNVQGNRLIYYENQQKELGLPCDSLFFKKYDNCWGNVLDTLSNYYALKDTCSYKFNRLNGTNKIEHAGSYIESADVDDNGTTDLLIGSVTLNTLTLLYNNGSKNYASILNQDATYPSYSTSFNCNSFGTPAFLDADNDGKTDLLVSTFDVGADNVNNIWYYRNTQNDGSKKIILSLVQKNFLLDNMIDAGTNSTPSFWDVDGDGLTDLIIGSSGFIENGNAPICKLLFYKNIGTATQPAFHLQEENFLNVPALGLKDIAPAVGDIDNDGDLDIVLGTSDGRIALWENTGTNNVPNFVYRNYIKDISNNEIAIGNNATPYLVDINRDGKTDLIIGEKNGNINYYKGTVTNDIKLSFVTDSLGKINIRPNNLPVGYTQPTIADINGDGKYDLILGTNTFGVQFYNNIEDNISGAFTLSAPLINFNNQRTTSSVADINNDGKAELVIGNINGGLVLYSKNPPPNISTGIQSSKPILHFRLFPNPADDFITIDIKENNGNNNLQLLNLIGQEVFRTNFSTSNTSINTSSLPEGMYILKLTTENKEGSQKIIILHR
ncbi:MAG TPA: FG-GAP-like repeat-containing protein [Chitinophagales bacterium]|nr:FG-GAP-like repeat-containing protein [Chitinophagales bacterium]